MANTTITMDTLRQIIRLKSEGTSNRKISKLLSIHRETIRKYVDQMTLLGIDYKSLLTESDVDLNLIFEKHQFVKTDLVRYNELRDFFPYAIKELGRTGVDRYNLWTEYKELHPQGYTYSHFCREYNRWYKTKEISAHFEYKAGEKLFIDFTGKNLCYVDKVIVPDNLKSAVTKACKYEPNLNESFENFAVHYGTTLLPTRPHEPQDKSLVEAAVRLIYKRVFAPIRNMTFFSLGELNVEIRRLMVLANALPFQIKEHNRTMLFNEMERLELRPLPEHRYEYKSYRWVTVQKTSHIYIRR